MRKSYKRNPVPEDLVYRVEIMGMPGVRTFGAFYSRSFRESFLEFFKSLKASGNDEIINCIALSGGGQGGAFGVGLLNGWTKSSCRPDFHLVTGVSTGALIAPFVFLGPKYDAAMKEIYTGISTSDICRSRYYVEIPFCSSLKSTRPLKHIIERIATPEFLAEIAAEHKKGKRLLVATSNLDCSLGTVWNMGEIACVKTVEAVKLFRKVLLASASIPVAFPPVLINVSHRGKIYDELHMDGGVCTEVFSGIDINLEKLWRAAGYERPPKFNQYTILNSKLILDWDPSKLNLIDLSWRAINNLIAYQAIGDLYRIYALSLRYQSNYNWIAIPQDFRHPSKELFDKKYMNELYNLSYDLAKGGNIPWKTIPPGYYWEGRID